MNKNTVLVYQSDWMKISETIEPVDVSNVKDIDNLDMKVLNKKSVEIDIDGVIGGDFWGEDDEKSVNTKEKMKKELRYLSELKADNITVNINSIGGSFAHALAMHDLLAMHKANVITKVSGMTASAATIIAQAGNDRQISDNALYLVHRASMGIISRLNQNQIMEIAENLKVFDNKIVDIYEKRSGKTRDELEEILDSNNGEGRWINAQEALKYGFVDNVFEPMKQIKDKSKVNITQLKNYKLPIPMNMENSENKSLLDQFKEFINDRFGKKEPENVKVENEPVEEPEDESQDEPENVKQPEIVEPQINNEAIELQKQLEIANLKIKELETEMLKKDAGSTKVESVPGLEDKDEIKLSAEELQVQKDLQKLRTEMTEVKYNY